MYTENWKAQAVNIVYFQKFQISKDLSTSQWHPKIKMDQFLVVISRDKLPLGQCDHFPPSSSLEIFNQILKRKGGTSLCKCLPKPALPSVLCYYVSCPDGEHAAEFIGDVRELVMGEWPGSLWANGLHYAKSIDCGLCMDFHVVCEWMIIYYNRAYGTKWMKRTLKHQNVCLSEECFSWVLLLSRSIHLTNCKWFFFCFCFVCLLFFCIRINGVSKPVNLKAYSKISYRGRSQKCQTLNFFASICRSPSSMCI